MTDWDNHITSINLQTGVKLENRHVIDWEMGGGKTHMVIKTEKVANQIAQNSLVAFFVSGTFTSDNLPQCKPKSQTRYTCIYL